MSVGTRKFEINLGNELYYNPIMDFDDYKKMIIYENKRNQE